MELFGGRNLVRDSVWSSVGVRPSREVTGALLDIRNAILYNLSTLKKGL